MQRNRVRTGKCSSFCLVVSSTLWLIPSQTCQLSALRTTRTFVGSCLLSPSAHFYQCTCITVFSNCRIILGKTSPWPLFCCYNLKILITRLHREPADIKYLLSCSKKKIIIIIITVWLCGKNVNSKMAIPFSVDLSGSFRLCLLRRFEAKRQHLIFHIWTTLPNLDLFIFSWFWRHIFTLRGIHIGLDLESSMWGCNPGPSWP